MAALSDCVIPKKEEGRYWSNTILDWPSYTEWELTRVEYNWSGEAKAVA